MNKKPNISKKFLDKINSVHASATQFFNSMNPEALQLIPIKVSDTSPSVPRKMKR
jgi:hypothetical protein